MSEPDRAWPGCHGVRVDGVPTFPLGTSRGEPLTRIAASLAPLRHAGRADVELWRRSAVTVLDGAAIAVEQRLVRRPSGSLLVQTSTGARLEYDAVSSAVVVDTSNDATAVQLLVSFGLPLALADHDVLVVHASACARDGRAVVVCGESGRGKSSLLIALVDAGWDAVSEDLCTIDLRHDVPLVWPGPPWVRRAHGEHGPRGASACFTTPDKVGWDLGDHRVEGPVPLDHVVVLDEPAGGAPVARTITRADAVAALAPHAVWVGDPRDLASRLFPRLVRMTAAARTSSVRLPRTPSWVQHVPQVFA